MSVPPVQVFDLIDTWAAHYFLEHDSYRFSVRNSQTNQAAEWSAPDFVIANVSRLFALKPERIELRQDSNNLHHTVVFEFMNTTHPSLDRIIISLAMPEGSFRVEVRLPSGGGVYYAFASEGSIGSFLTLFERARTTNASIGYSTQEKRVNFNF